MNQKELEVLCLIGTQKNANTFLHTLQQRASESHSPLMSQRQINHYFTGGTIMDIYDHFGSDMPLDIQEQLHRICLYSNSYSVRTRNILPGDHTYLIIKSPAERNNTSDGTIRMEFEYKIPNMTLEELDQALIKQGREYIAKRSRVRISYHIDTFTINIDELVGHGYVAKFETEVIHDENINEVHARIIAFMKQLGIVEITTLASDREGIPNDSRTFDLDSNENIIRFGFNGAQ